ncbi:uncharacterized protein TNCV_4768401 [Trichonephila clavipes]|nr:uncharacterized protein TNCV_4768401 [Trichonephila clavipes]
MAKFSYLPENKRYKIIHLKEEGYSMRQIAAKVPCGLSTVVRTLKIFSETNFIVDRGRSGRPRKTSLREDSDESQFCISGNQSSAYVRKHTLEEFIPQCLKPTVKYPTKVMVWGCMSSHGVGRLHIVSGTVKAMDYIEILQNKLLPTARDHFGNQPWIFQDDNAPCHRAKKKVIESVEEGERKVDEAKAFEIPLSSLSTILKNKEKIFSASSSRVRKCVSKGNFPHLKQCLVSLMRQCQGQNIPMGGSLLKEKAKAFAKELGIEFSASEGWLTKFKKRNGIVFKKCVGKKLKCRH